MLNLAVTNKFLFYKTKKQNKKKRWKQVGYIFRSFKVGGRTHLKCYFATFDVNLISKYGASNQNLIFSRYPCSCCVLHAGIIKQWNCENSCSYTLVDENNYIFAQWGNLVLATLLQTNLWATPLAKCWNYSVELTKCICL